MERLYTVDRRLLGCPLAATLLLIGQDLLVQIEGGCRAHVGSVSAACWEEGTLRTQTLCLPKHRDDVVGDRFARELAAQTGRNVTAVCGIHYDHATKDEIRQIIACTEEMLHELLSFWQTTHPA